MRRDDKKITDPVIIDTLIRGALVCRIAMYDGEMPYIVPFSFGYDGRSIYLHSARDGRKIDILRRNPRLCFEFETDCAVLPAEKACTFTMRYRSAIGYGVATFLDNPADKIAALALIMHHYSDREFTFSADDVKNIVVISIAIEQISAKQSGFTNVS
jgi:nitroimidazol reductase NimA-like FMN-containing flavoprotein (pyridoxamine 5'-phosphate oxidase superfamily)